VLNCLFRTSAGVSGMFMSPWRVSPLAGYLHQNLLTTDSNTMITRNSSV